MRVPPLLAVAFLSSMVAAQTPKYFEDASSVIGKKGTLNADGSFRINIGRSDIKFTNEAGMVIPTDMGLATYAAFSGSEDSALMVGDFALVRHEIDGVMDALRAGGVEIVALHNHMSTESPRLFFMHFQGKGSVASLSKTFRNALNKCGRSGDKPNQAKPGKPGKPNVDWNAIESALGVKPTIFESGVVRFAKPRKDLLVTIDSLPFLPGMGLGSWAAFSLCDCGETMVMGDTACGNRTELQASIDALRAAGISITAIHNHIFGGSQELIFMHYEGESNALKMAQGIRKCWDLLGIPK